MTARAILGAGLVTLNLWNPVTQKWMGEGDPLDADKFAITPSFEEKTSTSKSHLDYGQARASVILPSPTSIGIDIAAASGIAFGMQFQGLVESLQQAAGSTTAPQDVAVKPGLWVSLGKRNLTEAGLTVHKEDGTTPLALGADFEINWLSGKIRTLVTGAGADETKIKVAYAWAAEDGTRILGGRNPQVRAQAFFHGVNMVDGSPLEANVHEAVLAASNEFDFLASDYVAISLTGKVVTPAGKTEGYEVLMAKTPFIA